MEVFMGEFTVSTGGQGQGQGKEHYRLIIKAQDITAARWQAEEYIRKQFGMSGRLRKLAEIKLNEFNCLVLHA